MALGLSVSWLGDLCLALGFSVICGNYVWHWVCLFVCYLWELCWALGLSVCWLGVAFKIYAIFIPCSKLGLALGLSVSWLGDLCLALGLSVCLLFFGNYFRHWFVCLSVICGNYVGHWVCLFVGWVTYV